jgi:hypothetical protein
MRLARRFGLRNDKQVAIPIGPGGGRIDASYGGDFKLVDGWLTFSGVKGDASQLEAACKTGRGPTPGTPSVLMKVLSSSQN